VRLQTHTSLYETRPWGSVAHQPLTNSPRSSRRARRTD
jgi:hypothetical protein